MIRIQSNSAMKRLAERKEQEGKWVRLAPGIFADSPHNLEQQIWGEWKLIFQSLGWDGRLAYRSALPDGLLQKEVILVGTKDKSLQLGPVHLKMYKGNASELDAQGCTPLYGNILKPSMARALVENMSVRAGDRKKIASKPHTLDTLHSTLDHIYATQGLTGLVEFEQELEQLKTLYHPNSVQRVLDATQAWKTGLNAFVPYDVNEMKHLKIIKDRLMAMTWTETKTESTLAQVFFEAYFSNYIEGTRLDVEEALGLLDTPPQSLKLHLDEHDVEQTIRLIQRDVQHGVQWNSAEDFKNWLKQTHQNMFVHRQDIHPGMWKTQNNRVGTTSFVNKEWVDGTLERLFELTQDMPLGMARALLLSTGFVRIHPFEDGNGRMSRLILNAELQRAGLTRVMIPQVMRMDYLNALKLWSNHQDPSSLGQLIQKLGDIMQDIDWKQAPKALVQTLQQKNAFEEDPHAKWIFDVRQSKPKQGSSFNR